MAFLLILAVPAAVIIWLVSAPLLRRRRRDGLRSQPFPDDWDARLHERLPIYSQLPDALRRRLQQSMQVFLAEKTFVGCKGLEINIDIRLAIAAQACLLIMARDDSDYDALSTVLVYPSSFFVEHESIDAAGVWSRQRRLLSGESWEQGQVVLAWDEARPAKAGSADGFNVVIHEFAHQLDQIDGDANGAPALDDAAAYARWNAAMSAAYGHLCSDVDAGTPTLLDPYGAESPGEFFAVACEVFFEMPGELAQTYPELYEAFCVFFRIDPRTWGKASEAGAA